MGTTGIKQNVKKSRFLIATTEGLWHLCIHPKMSVKKKGFPSRAGVECVAREGDAGYQVLTGHLARICSYPLSDDEKSWVPQTKKKNMVINQSVGDLKKGWRFNCSSRGVYVCQ